MGICYSHHNANPYAHVPICDDEITEPPPSAFEYPADFDENPDTFFSNFEIVDSEDVPHRVTKRSVFSYMTRRPKRFN